jgi:hyperosmotically inducible protein
MQRLFLVTCVIALLSSCQSYREEGSRTIGEFTDDVAIQTKVKTALIRDDDIKGLRINVEVSKGVVTLYGPISSNNARRKAVKLVRDIRGVTEVQDRLTLVNAD